MAKNRNFGRVKNKANSWHGHPLGPARGRLGRVFTGCTVRRPQGNADKFRTAWAGNLPIL